jgi:hypothetical protein
MNRHFIITIIIVLAAYFVGAKFPMLAQKVGLVG